MPDTDWIFGGSKIPVENTTTVEKTPTAAVSATKAVQFRRSRRSRRRTTSVDQSAIVMVRM